MGRLVSGWPKAAAAALAAAWLSACSTGVPTERLLPGETPPLYTLEAVAAPGALAVLEVPDPMEPTNRAIYRLNATFDRAIFLPVVGLYEFVTPTVVQDGVSGFFSNLTEIPTFANAILQGKLERASRALVRFGVNSTLGLGGLYDLMDELGTGQQREDMGQTLGAWGVPDGPYLVLPILGPSNLRDAAGMVGDRVAFWLADPLWLATLQDRYPAISVLEMIDRRHGVGFQYHETGSAFEYELVRLLYTRQRQLEVQR
jgi:phospholipid-binding lipoprotein MlaA